MKQIIEKRAIKSFDEQRLITLSAPRPKPQPVIENYGENMTLA